MYESYVVQAICCLEHAGPHAASMVAAGPFSVCANTEAGLRVDIRVPARDRFDAVDLAGRLLAESGAPVAALAFVGVTEDA